MIAQSDRIYLRRFEMGDAQFLFELNADPEVLQYTGDPPFASVAEASQFVMDYDHYQKYGHGRWMVIHKENDEPLGWCGIKYTPRLDEHDLGFRFAKRYWGQGYATESSKLVVQYGFEMLGLETIVGRAMVDNVASIRVLTKVGFTFQKQISMDGQSSNQYILHKPLLRQ